MITQSSYDTLLVGATCSSMAFGLTQPGNHLLVESSVCMAWEYTETMYPGAGLEGAALATAEGRRVYDDLKKHRIVEDGRLHVAALSPYFFSRLKDSELDYSFLTHVVSVEPQGDDFIVSLMDISGHRQIIVKRIIDTTTTGETRRSVSVDVLSVAIGVALKADVPGEGVIPEPNADAAFYTSTFEDEGFMSLSLPVGTDWPAARQAFHDFWVSRNAAWKSWDVVSVGSRLKETVMPLTIDHANWQHSPAMHHDNALSAVDFGASGCNIDSEQKELACN